MRMFKKYLSSVLSIMMMFQIGNSVLAMNQNNGNTATGDESRFVSDWDTMCNEEDVKLRARRRRIGVGGDNAVPARELQSEYDWDKMCEEQDEKLQRARKQCEEFQAADKKNQQKEAEAKEAADKSIEVLREEHEKYRKTREAEVRKAAEENGRLTKANERLEKENKDLKERIIILEKQLNPGISWWTLIKEVLFKVLRWFI